MLSSQAFDRGWNVEILGDEVDEKNLMQPLQWQRQEFTGGINLRSFKRFAIFSTGSICRRYRLVNIPGG